MYYTVIADIINSKQIEARRDVQKKLEKLLNDVNEKYSNYIVSKFCITIGDEFQGILSGCKKLFEIITFIEIKMHPVKLRFAVGLGNIDTDINKEMSIGSDGPAWWEARKALDSLKKKAGRGLKDQANVMIAAGNKKIELTALVNVILSIAGIIKEKWKEEHRKIILHIIENYGLTSGIVQKKAADGLNMKVYDLNKKLKTSRYFDYAMAFERVTDTMEVLDID